MDYTMKRIILFSGLLIAAAPVTSRAADKALDELVKPFFAKNCVSCHGATKPKGDLRLDTLTVDFDSPKIMAHWEEIMGRINRGEMHTKKKTRPRADDVAR